MSKENLLDRLAGAMKTLGTGEEKMWYGRSDMPDYLPVGWDKSSNWRY